MSVLTAEITLGTDELEGAIIENTRSASLAGHCLGIGVKSSSIRSTPLADVVVVIVEIPDDPNPRTPLCVAGKSVVTTTDGDATHSTKSWAMRSPLLT